MASTAVLTAQQVGELLAYDPATGDFTWRAGRKGINSGTTAGCISSHLGYRLIGVLRQRHYAHRLAWLLTFGEWPAHQIDHINGDRADNRLVNLREATHAENQQNRHITRGNKTGYRGVFLHRPTGMYVAQCRVMKKRHHIGSFKTAEDAHAAYMEARAKLNPYANT